MIYVLVLNAFSYDDQDELIFASTSKEVVEKKRQEMLALNVSLQIYSALCKIKMDEFCEDNKMPYWNCRTRTVEFDKLFDEYNKKLLEFREETLQSIKEQYYFSEEMLAELDKRGNNLLQFDEAVYLYSIKEVESD